MPITLATYLYTTPVFNTATKCLQIFLSIIIFGLIVQNDSVSQSSATPLPVPSPSPPLPSYSPYPFPSPSPPIPFPFPSPSSPPYNRYCTMA